MDNTNFEIERKYLVKSIPFSLDNFEKKDIEQSYISKLPTIRLRKANNKHFLTVKGTGDVKRVEFEMEISDDEYSNLLKKIDGNIIKKTRYYIPIENNLIAELDLYHTFLEGLITVEVEFKCEEDEKNFTAPEWFYKDISSLAQYKNACLSNGVYPSGE